MLLLRHAWAGDSARWQGDDRERPLDERGRAQAEALVAGLASYRIDAIVTSPYRRCVETVRPFADAGGPVVEEREELGVERQDTDGVALVRSLAGQDVLLCGHGGLERALVDPPKWKKGSLFVVDANLRVERVLRF